MQLEIQKLIYDILTSIQSIDGYIENNRTFEFYLANKVVRRAVEREIEIIGEAVKRISDFDATFIITNAKSIINTRNRVIHAYDSVDNTIIWGIVIKHLPNLKAELEQLINNNDEP